MTQLLIKALTDQQNEYAQYGYENKGYATPAEYGRWADLVGMAFDCLTHMQRVSEAHNWDNQLANTAEDEAGDAYDAILATVKELL